MKIEISWSDISVIIIERVKGVYISNVDINNFVKAKECGMPVSCISKIELISKKLPFFIEDRIPVKALRDKSLDVISNDEGANILRYIEITKCKNATDKFKIDLT